MLNRSREVTVTFTGALVRKRATFGLSVLPKDGLCAKGAEVRSASGSGTEISSLGERHTEAGFFP